MAESSDVQDFVLYLRQRWRVPVAAVGLALAAALAVSLLSTRRYTARVSLLIEPPASVDPRAALAVSPIYLESLQTYEHFASSDQLFAEAAARFHLQTGAWKSRPLEDLKRSVLQISIPRNTKVLQIAVTLPDAQRAHALAGYLAVKTIELSRATDDAATRELVAAAKHQFAQALERLREAGAALSGPAKLVPSEDAIKAEFAALGERRNEMERMALAAELTVADLEQRRPSDRQDEALQSARARAARLRKEAGAVAGEISRREQQFAAQRAEIERLTAEYEAAERAREETSKRLRDVQGMVGFGSERISLLDPGFVPERPSSPNLPLNLFAGAGLAVFFSVFYLTFAFGFRSGSAVPPREVPKIVGRR